jgi:hypothetical protein
MTWTTRNSYVLGCHENRRPPEQPRPGWPWEFDYVIVGTCEECLKEGTRWVELRECQTCGHVGCCDSSGGKHATKHFHETGHSVMGFVMPGATWSWCYVHEVEGLLA